MHKRYAAIDEARDSDVRGITDCACEHENLTAAGMGPPRALYRPARDRVYQTWNRAARSLQHHSVSFYETERLLGRHLTGRIYPSSRKTHRNPR